MNIRQFLFLFIRRIIYQKAFVLVAYSVIEAEIATKAAELATSLLNKVLK